MIQIIKLTLILSLCLLSSCGGSSTVTAPWIGTKQLGVAGALTYGQSVATDASGNVYVTGYTDRGLDGNTLTGSEDFFVTKYNSSGVKQFTRQLGTTGVATLGESVATDISGNVYVAGHTWGGLEGNTMTGMSTFFVIKYDSSGNKQYISQMGNNGITEGMSVTTDAGGNVFIAGTTTVGLDGNTMAGLRDVFVTKYDSSGNVKYTRQMGVAGALTSGNSVATDASGNFFVAGSTTGGLDSNTLTGSADFFVTKYNSSGVKQYTKQMGVAGAATAGKSVATDASGNFFVAGVTWGKLDGNTLTGTQDVFVTKYDSSGAWLYTKQMGVAGQATYGQSVATDASGNVFVAGYTSGGLDGNTLTGLADVFVTKYDSSGAKLYTKQMGVAGLTTNGHAVAIDASGNAFVAGFTYGGLDGNTLTGTTDSFVTKYSNSGVKQ